MKQNKPIALIILDGFGYRKNNEYNAIAQANTPNLDRWFKKYPHAFLHASGSYVGLLDTQIGNSDVGHTTIGAGRIVQQPAAIMHEAIHSKSFFNNPILKQKLEALQKSGAPLHIMGLLSDAGVHSDIQELYAFLDAAHQHGIKHVFIHAFLDGRDVAPRSAAEYLQPLEDALTQLEYGSIGSIHGRFYAMDRDNNWDRTQKSYDVLTQKNYVPYKSWQQILHEAYGAGSTEEFIMPQRIDPTSVIEPRDGIIFFNFRADRARQLTAAFVQKDFDHFPIQRINPSCFITPIAYADYLKTDVLFPRPIINHTLLETIHDAGKTLFTSAETEKYAHVTYFINGGIETPYARETRVLIPSHRVSSFAERPAMSAPTITDAVLNSLHTNPADFYLINYANADMVGHSGNMQATIQAIECLDRELGKLYTTIVEEMDGIMFITGDHGNAEEMFDPEKNTENRAHTTNPVPFLAIGKQFERTPSPLPINQLADIAPFILKIMEIPVPKEMRKPENPTWIF